MTNLNAHSPQLHDYFISAGDDWTPQIALVKAGDFDHAHIQAIRELSDDWEFVIYPMEISDRTTGETQVVLSVCPECSMSVIRDTEEWMLTDMANVYQHVDCYWSGRLPNKTT